LHPPQTKEYNKLIKINQNTMGMNSAPTPASPIEEQERPKLSTQEESQIRDQVKRLDVEVQKLINQENEIREGAGADEYKNPKIDIVIRQRLALERERDQLGRRLTTSDLESNM
jgi:hypothetical protein